MFKTKVILSYSVEKRIHKLPKQVINKLYVWQKQVQFLDIRKTRTIKGYHNEPLQGDRQEQRSFCLNKAYRGFYTVSDSDEIEIVEVVEINKHKY
tara:strand:- start:793 stop:1077 length:285 start_codon:yes stop_codon:yes gene_type:complete